MIAFLINYGQVVGIALVAALTIASLAAIRAIGRARATRASRADVALRAEAVGRLAPGPVCLRGRLRDGDLATVSRGLYAETTVTHDVATGAPWLELPDGTRVDLAAPIRVELGSRGTHTRTWPVAAPASARAPLAHAHGPIRHLQIARGDDVIVRGVARASTQGHDYRGDVVPWSLVGERAGEPIAVAAIAPVLAARPPLPIVMPLVGFGLAIVWVAALFTTGKIAIARGASELALVTPMTQHEALVDLRWRMPADDTELRAQVVAAIGDCRSAQEEFDHGRYALAADHADASCDERGLLRYTAMLAAGQYERAFHLDRAGHRRAHMIAAIASGHLLDAGADAQMLARHLDDVATTYADQVNASDHACFAELARAFAGAPDAFTYTPRDRLATRACDELEALAVDRRVSVPFDANDTHAVAIAHYLRGEPQGDLHVAADPLEPSTILLAVPGAKLDAKRSLLLVLAWGLDRAVDPYL